MKNYFLLFRLLTVIFLLGVISSCNHQNSDRLVVEKQLPEARYKKGKKGPDHIKGIEHMANYRKDIMKPIGAEEISYEKGHQMTELEKMVNNGLKMKNSSSILDVSERGPVNVPGRIRGLEIAPDDKNKWYAGTVGGGLWITKDGGVTWENVTDYKVPSLATSTIAVSKTNPGTLYVGTGEAFGNLDGIDGIGILKSVNDGKNWTYLENTKFFGDIGRMAINPQDDNHLVVASTTGVHLTLDGGKTWFNPYFNNDNDPNVQDLAVNPADFNIMYGGVKNIGIIKSIDGGRSWELIFDREDYNPAHDRFELDISPANPDKLFVSVYTRVRAATNDSPATAATTAVNTDFYISPDGGATFTLLGFEGEPADGNLVTSQGWYDNIITAHPTDENVFYVGGVAVFKVNITEEMNFAYTPIASGYDRTRINDEVHVDQHNIVWDINEEGKIKLILANDGGIYFTDYLEDPGVTEGDWSGIAQGLNNTQFYGADKQNGSDNYMAGAQDNGSWAYFGATAADENSAYFEYWGGDGFEVIWNYNDPTRYIGGSQFNNFVRVVGDRRFLARHADYGSGTSPFYSKITNANNNPEVVFSVSKNGVWRSTDFAATWKLTPITDRFSLGRSRSQLNVAVSTANPDVVWTGLSMRENATSTLHVSTDNGQSFSPTNTFNDPRPNSIRVHNFFLSGLATSPTEENRAYALFGSKNAAKVLKTEDLGQTWTDISGFSLGINTGFPDVAVHCLIEMPFDEDVLWAGTDIGVIQTKNGGENWTLIEELPNVSVWQMKIVNDQVVMATHGRGVWTVTLEELAAYEPLPYFAPPSIISVAQESIENQNAVVTYVQQNENVQKLKVYMDGDEVAEIDENTEAGTEFTYTFENLEEGLHEVGLRAIDNTGRESIIGSGEVHIIDFKEVADEISLNEFGSADIYTFGDEFVIEDLQGSLEQPVLVNRDRPYADAAQYRTVLKQPITLSGQNNIFKYEDVAMVEPEAVDGQFYDVVVVEAASDLNDWKVLDVYDARRFPEWLEEYNANGPGATINDGLFREQSINLLDFFNEGEVVAVRFRLISDGNTNSFGWAIKNINKSETLTVTENVVASGTFKIFPTVSNGAVRLLSNATLKDAMINVFGLDGKSVYSKQIDLIKGSVVDLSLDNLNSGMYMVHIGDKKNTTTVQRVIIK